MDVATARVILAPFCPYWRAVRTMVLVAVSTPAVTFGSGAELISLASASATVVRVSVERIV